MAYLLPSDDAPRTLRAPAPIVAPVVSPVVRPIVQPVYGPPAPAEQPETFLIPAIKDDAPVRIADQLSTSDIGVLKPSDIAEKILNLNYAGGDPNNPIVQAVVELQRQDNIAAQKEWETVSRPTGFGDFIVDGFGNLAAGIVNAVVPGSNLGDERNASNFVGNVVGSVGGLFVNPLGIAESIVSKAGDMSFLSNAIDFVGKVAGGPIGTIGSTLLNSYVGSFTNSMTAQAAAFNAPTAQNIAETKSAPAQAAAFGSVGQDKWTATGGGTTISNETTAKTSPWVWVGVAVAFLVTLVMIFKRK